MGLFSKNKTVEQMGKLTDSEVDQPEKTFAELLEELANQSDKTNQQIKDEVKSEKS